VYSGIQSAAVKTAYTPASTGIAPLARINGSRGAVTVCAHPESPNITRAISVTIPEQPSGLICQVTEEVAGRVTHPWNAAHDFEYCADKARDMTTSLMGSGWACLTP
jgi:hypothetical protein